jgi:hypothetical protein
VGALSFPASRASAHSSTSAMAVNRSSSTLPLVDAPAVAEAPFASDPKHRAFREECDTVLLQFERAQEWADLIRYLARLQRTLNKYAQMPWIPDKVLVAKRLYQCLNPALPSGGACRLEPTTP